MKALIRKKGEIVTVNDSIVGIDWSTGAPLTNHAWAGGPYTLVNDYVPEDPTGEFTTDLAPEPAQDPVVEEVPDTIIIDGVKYARAT